MWYTDIVRARWAANHRTQLIDDIIEFVMRHNGEDAIETEIPFETRWSNKISSIHRTFGIS